MVRWMGAEATLDPRPGGVCRINPSGHAVMSRKLLEADPPRRLVLACGWETESFATPPQSAIVEVTLTQDGAETIMHLAHRRLKHSAVAFHRAGWEHYLPRLSLLATGADPGADPWRDIAVDLTELRNAGVATRRSCR